MEARYRDELVENAPLLTRLGIRRAKADFSALRVAVLNRLIVAPVLTCHWGAICARQQRSI